MRKINHIYMEATELNVPFTSRGDILGFPASQTLFTN